MADGATPLQVYGLWVLGATIVLLFVFLSFRGRVPIDRGWGGMTIRRFAGFERACHWLLALSFLVLALTGFAQLYGVSRQPLLGAETMAALQAIGPPLHNAFAFVFTLTLAVTFLLWVRHSLPSWRDAVWVAKGGGMLVKGTTPAAWKFNAGQKLLFWIVVLGGLAMILTGAALHSPYRTGMVSKTFAIVAGFGVQVPVDALNLTPAREAHYARLWHGWLAIGLVCAVIVHVYLRTLGMQGALSAMTSGDVDVNLARQQHSLWAQRELQRLEQQAFGAADSKPTPAK